MILRHKRDTEIIDLLRQYKRIKRDQIRRIFRDNVTEHRIAGLLKEKFIIEEDGYLRMAEQSNCKYSYNEYKAFEALIYFMQNFKDKLTYHTSEEYPFTLLFVLNGKLYDIAVMEPGQEELQCQLINRSQSERVLAVVEDLDQARKIKNMIKDKELGILTVEGTTVTFYEDAES